MGNATNNELWQAFFTEVSEQLDNLELILGDPDAAQRADIHQLFRDFHTIKSSCAMMDFHSMERIAHASEDYLDLVRKGRTTLDSETVGMLLSGIDWLKGQLQRTRQTGDAPEDNVSLHQALLALSARYSIQESVPTPATSSTFDDKHALPAEARLSDDEITEFASACKDQLLAGLMPSADATAVKRALNKLVTICNLVNFTALSALLRKYIRLHAAQEIQRSREAAADILERIQTIETRYSTDCGSTALHTQFLDTLFPDFAQFSGRLEFLLDTLEQHPDDPLAFSDCEHMLHVLGVYTSLFGFVQLRQFYRYTLQLLRSIRRGDFPEPGAAFIALRLAFDFPVAEAVHAGENEIFRSALQSRLADLQVSIAQALVGASYEQAREAVSSRLELPDALLLQLMPGPLDQLQAAVSKGTPVVAVMLDSSCDPDLLEQLMAAITRSGTLIHTFTTLPGQEGQAFAENLQCLVCCPEGLDPLHTNLRDADPSGRHARCTVFRYHDAAPTPAQAAPTPDTTPAPTARPASTTLRIDSTMLDQLVTQVGEIIMLRNRLQHILGDPQLQIDGTAGTEQERAALAHARKQLDETVQRLQQAIGDIQDRILDLRVIPVSSVFDRIPQLVRKMADSQQKSIQLVIHGKEVRIDKGMVDILMEPLIHLVRNCIDHGIEPPAERAAQGKPAEATLVLDASQEGSMLVLRIADDGRGINVARIRDSAIRKGFIQATDVLTDEQTYRLIFLPGFSTAETITETSGRGVGMDVVINRVNHIGGDIDVQSSPGKGTRFFLKLPLSAAIQGVVLVEAGARLYAVPQNAIAEVVPVRPAQLESLHGQTLLRLRDQLIPAYRLEDLVLQAGKPVGHALEFTPIELDDTATMLVLQRGQQRIAVLVEELAGREEVFIRGLHRDLRNLQTLSGAAVLGNGRLVFILNSAHLLRHASKSPAFQLTQAAEA